MRINATRYVILGLLTEGPLTGYDIKKLVEIRFRFFWSESYGQIYPQLRTMEQEELIETSSEASVGRKKHVYHITEAGKQAFALWMNKPPETEHMRMEFLLKLFWAPWVGGKVVDTYVQDFGARHAEQLEVLKSMQSELEGIIDESENHWWIHKTIELGTRINATYVSWAQELREAMEDRP